MEWIREKIVEVVVLVYKLEYSTQIFKRIGSKHLIEVSLKKN